MSTVKNILILGGESTGKSSLASALAEHYNTQYVPEYARIYLNEIKRPYTEADLVFIAQGQLALEEALREEAQHMLFCDTGLDVLAVWSQHKYGRVDAFILNGPLAANYDAILVTAPDLPWEADPQREHPNEEDRAFFFAWYEQIAIASNKPYTIIEGEGTVRVEQAIAFLTQTFSERVVD